jgi:proton-dependent oligopeptide transporter, POT family
LYYAEEKYGRKLVVETIASFKVLIMFIPVPLFWSLYLQQNSRFVFQASKMNLDLKYFTVKPDQISVVNSILVVILIPVFDKFLYPTLEKLKVGSLLYRMIFGNICTMIAFVIAAILQTQVDRNFISVLWQIPSILFLAFGEVFMYISHMSFAYKEAPVSMKPVMVAFFYLTIATGGLFVAIISGISMFKSQVHEYLFFAFLMLFDILLMSFLTLKYKHTDHEMIKALSAE